MSGGGDAALVAHPLADGDNDTDGDGARRGFRDDDDEVEAHAPLLPSALQQRGEQPVTLVRRVRSDSAGRDERKNEIVVDRVLVPATAASPVSVEETVMLPRSKCAQFRAFMTPARIAKLLVAVALLGGLLGVFVYLSKSGLLVRFFEYVREFGVGGYFIVCALLLVAQVPFVPGHAIALVGGAFLYGWMMLIGSTLSVNIGAALVFVVLRMRCQPWLQRKIARQPRVAVIDEAISMNAFKMMLLIRLAPLPHNIVTLLLAASKAPLRMYLAATLVGSTLELALLTYVGTTLGDLANMESLSWSPGRIALISVQGTVLVAVTIIIIIVARRQYRIVAARMARQRAAAGESPAAAGDPEAPATPPVIAPFDPVVDPPSAPPPPPPWRSAAGASDNDDDSRAGGSAVRRLDVL